MSLTSLAIVSNEARVNLNGTFDHPADSYSTGRLTGHIEGDRVALARIQAVRKARPDLDGLLHLNLDADAVLHPPGTTSRVELAAVNGTLGFRDLRHGGSNMGEAEATSNT